MRKRIIPFVLAIALFVAIMPGAFVEEAYAEGGWGMYILNEAHLSTYNGSNEEDSVLKVGGAPDDRNPVWTSSNESVATVDQNGVVTAWRYGTAEIIVTAEDLSLTSIVTVDFYDAVEGVKNGDDVITENIANSIRWLADEGITKGYDDGVYFGSFNDTARKDFVIFLWRYAGKPTTKSTKTFKDTKSYAKTSDTYKAISWATSVGIINGYSDGTFRPNDPVTRAQVAVMLWKFAGKPSESSLGTVSSFPDVSVGNAGLTENMVKAINWCNNTGLVKGYSSGANSGKFVPSGNCKRFQMAIILKRYNDNI